MKERTLHYFIPQNPEELETLIGKTVGVKIKRFERETDAIPCGLCKVRDHYEFLVQDEDEEGKPKRKIVGYKSNIGNIEFNDNWVLIPPITSRFISNEVHYTPRSKRFKDRLALLEQNNLWREPQ